MNRGDFAIHTADAESRYRATSPKCPAPSRMRCSACPALGAWPLGERLTTGPSLMSVNMDPGRIPSTALEQREVISQTNTNGFGAGALLFSVIPAWRIHIRSQRKRTLIIAGRPDAQSAALARTVCGSASTQPQESRASSYRTGRSI